MAIQVGDPIPDVTLRVAHAEGPRVVSSREALGGGRTVLFALPGAFTATCSDVHLPGYQTRVADLRAAGVETIACLASNDHHVMAAWGKARGVDDDIVLLADGNGDFTRAMGLEIDLSAFGLGRRTRRYAAVLEHGVVRHLAVEPGPGVSVSGAEEVLKYLRQGEKR